MATMTLIVGITTPIAIVPAVLRLVLSELFVTPVEVGNGVVKGLDASIFEYVSTEGGKTLSGKVDDEPDEAAEISEVKVEGFGFGGSGEGVDDGTEGVEMVELEVSEVEGSGGGFGELVVPVLVVFEVVELRLDCSTST